MKEIFSAILRYKFGSQFRLSILFCLVLLVLFHVFVLVAPFFDAVGITISEKHIQHLRATSNSVANVTVAFILMFLIVEGQRSVCGMISRQRKQTYAQTESQILEWFKLTRPQIFDFEANVINSEPVLSQEILRNFKVEGSPKKITQLYNYEEIESVQLVEKYCKDVHFELTCYPTEIMYGIHIEFDDYELSQEIYRELEKSLALTRQSKDFIIDDMVPKKPGWIFITKTIMLEGDEDKDFPKILTEARHFVELVGHSYVYLYDKKLIDIYIYHKMKSNKAI